jgi:hypothetical protein
MRRAARWRGRGRPHAPELLTPDEYELGGGLRPLAEVRRRRPLTPGERGFLTEALPSFSVAGDG